MIVLYEIGLVVWIKELGVFFIVDIGGCWDICCMMYFDLVM